MPRTVKLKNKEEGDDEPVPLRRSLRLRGKRDNDEASVKSADMNEDEGQQKKVAKKKVTTTTTQPSKTVDEEAKLFPKFALDKPKIDDNILKRLDLLQYGRRQDQKSCLKMIGNSLVEKSVQQLKANYVNKWKYGITALTWHQKHPYTLAIALSVGNIMVLSGIPNDPELRHECPLKFETKTEIQIEGNRRVNDMKFHEDLNLLYFAGNGCVARIDLEHGTAKLLLNTVERKWFHSLDLNLTINMLLAGDNQGIVHHFSTDGNLVGTWRLHQYCIYHLEFSKKDPNLLVSAAIPSFGEEGGVKMWDIRNIKHSRISTECEPLHSLDHKSAVKCAKFSPIDGSRLLTTDMQAEVRVYQEGPLWKDHIVIKHHRLEQFANLADWHPVNEYIVVGRYEIEQEQSAAAIEFFDSYSGELVKTIYPPHQDAICSLNVFNPTGEYLASGTDYRNGSLILWEPGLSLDKLPSSNNLPG